MTSLLGFLESYINMCKDGTCLLDPFAQVCVFYLSCLIAPSTQGKQFHEFCFRSKSWIEGSKLCANFTPLVPPRLPPSPSSNKSNVVKSAARSRAPGGRCQGGALSRRTTTPWPQVEAMPHSPIYLGVTLNSMFLSSDFWNNLILHVPSSELCCACDVQLFVPFSS